jgi:hypothetical protein
MPTAQDVLWFKSEFQPRIEAQLVGTPFSVDMVTAFACQETGEIWPALRKQGLPTARILELCVGDTIDASPTGGGRRAFPKNKAELLAAADGERMFQLARQGLLDMAQYIPGYRGAAARPDKFCHGFGIFQLDLQFFKTEPDYFLARRYADFDAALARCIGELNAALKRVGWQAKTSLSDAEMAGVAIAYNTGRYDPAKGLKQGYFDGAKYYGENYFAYLQLAKAAPVAQATATTRGVAAKARKTTVAKAPPATKVAAKKIAAKKGAAKKGATRKAAAKEVVAKKPLRRPAPRQSPAPKTATPKRAAKKAASAGRSR